MNFIVDMKYVLVNKSISPLKKYKKWMDKLVEMAI